MMTKFFHALLLLLFQPSLVPALAFGTGSILSTGPETAPLTSSRRQLLQNIAALAATTTLGFSQPSLAADDELIEVWFGCGCFWHVQHEFVEAERKILGRSDKELTARAGYAGGKAGAKDGKVCYHNAAQVSDYGSLGHAEVVSLKIPTSSFPDFVAEYTALFNKDGYRPDQFQDTGPEYRNLVGFPGGVNSPLAKQLVEVSAKNGDKLDFAKGKGDDSDARALVFVMDSDVFPVFVAEQYHQFHDGFNFGENYPNSYNGLASTLAKEGSLGESKCPNGLLGVGLLGL
ncbi:expressed unknown protein [Seminavis robusta]|uniref:Peptide-methionine (S)-S-oxide reductase n=1 Tax=Seminavis robusta TaxID=568900 RepID=A0A9N8HJK0_9STRA|nr:expressed unknown protein [Seminavis robusta]|eukprot:Sro866_g213060.1 n/a (288) ;mRNA; f:31727-32590